VAACAAGIGLTSTATASADRYGHYYDDYATVVDVTEAGADDTGSESITPVLEKLRDDNTLLVFPEGEYFMDEQFRFTGFDNFGVVGENATLVPADFHEFNGPRYRLFRLGVSSRPGGRVRFEGFDVDQRAPTRGSERSRRTPPSASKCGTSPSTANTIAGPGDPDCSTLPIPTAEVSSNGSAFRTAPRGSTTPRTRVTTGVDRSVSRPR